ncbi:MAG: hypothetical protein JOZ57_14120, partial [Abitibacteriaceae bacterium]|nr:hypothetical protein [Abditibacteriaceae bacterium]
WPSSTQLHTLCYLLQATTEEMVALTTGDLSPQAEAPLALEGKVSLHELRVQGHHLNFYTTSGPAEALKELSYVTLETQAWPLATRAEQGGQALAALYSHHAHYLAAHQRFGESGVYATRALELWPQEIPLNPTMLQACIAMARSAVHRGPCPAPQRGLEVLGYWSQEARWPEYEAWLLSEMAAYMIQVGSLEQGLFLSQRAKEIAAWSENHHALYNRELDQARLLLEVGQARQALGLIQRPRLQPYTDQPAKFTLLEVEAYLQLQETALAHDRLQEAEQLIESGSLGHLRPQAQTLSLHF